MLGRFATSKAGHDKGTLYVIVGEQDEFVFLCDGKRKTLEHPKKKRLKHIQIINRKVEGDLPERLQNHARVLNEEIKYAIRHYDDIISAGCTCDLTSKQI